MNANTPIKMEWINLGLINPPPGECCHEYVELTTYADACETLGFSLYPIILKENEEGRYDILDGEFLYHAARRRARLSKDPAYSVNALVVRASDSAEAKDAATAQVDLHIRYAL